MEIEFLHMGKGRRVGVRRNKRRGQKVRMKMCAYINSLQ